jgi:DNA primase
MNVKICTFPQGEDPDSFAKQNTLEELKDYLKSNAKDFIAYKASLLMEEAQNDPVAKANLIRDMVTSISKVSDNIQKEIYVRECSRIMDISEDVLFSTLAQMGKKAQSDANKTYNKKQKAFEVVKSVAPPKKVDIQYELEQKIIEILLLYGSRKESFEDLILKENDKEELVLEPVIHQVKVFEKIFLDLQEDEMQFTNENFKILYYTIIDSLNQTDDFVIESFVNRLDPTLASDVTNILMNEERYSLHNWEKNNIFPKQKEVSIAQLVSETILTLRCYLIDRKVNEIKKDTQDTVDHRGLLEDVLNYSNLKMLLSRKLNRVL